MTQEDKDLLLKDLCGRLPYGVKVHAKCVDMDTNTEIEKVGVLSMIDTDTVVAFTTNDTNCYIYVTIHEIKPYLFPMSSMTEEQLHLWRDEWWDDLAMCVEVNYPKSEEFQALSDSKSIDWLNKRHIDYRGLIEKGLAIDATGLNIY